MINNHHSKSIHFYDKMFGCARRSPTRGLDDGTTLQFRSPAAAQNKGLSPHSCARKELALCDEKQSLVGEFVFKLRDDGFEFDLRAHLQAQTR